MPHSLTPAQAWQMLRDGNQRFVDGASIHPNQDSARRSELVNDQNPVCVIFGCSDSRLAAEIIFDLGLGDAFVVRSAGHVLDEAVLGSLEYAVEPLNVPLIVILGHDSCGAVTASVNAYETGEMPQGFVRDLVERIMPSVLTAQRQGVTDVNGTVVEHAKQTGPHLLETSQIIAKAVEEGRTAVLSVCYHLAEGKAELVSHVGQI
ncbi:carbonic anhydrase [Sinomonas sp. JC656]|uniref:Carbonic anhydrase n=1 Tax=Sinomonas cellulolyticus TaxID=2801916 RepID=A0ABS1K2A6_9MICC|nr:MULTISPECIES: carbonic anhydrase [Sinomonas]MBL0704441.1 carbonic anhydrase [Sinomonas cellulolyticus]